MFKRHLTPALLVALSDSPVVFLNGPRQSGKSTLVQSLAAGPHRARYLTLDDLAVLSAVRADPQGFLAGLDGPVILDEVQRAPELFLPLKVEVDRERRPGRFLLTGSASVAVLPRLSQALVGRMEILTLWPLSQGEVEGVKEGFIDALFEPNLSIPDFKAASRADLLERVVRGGYPEPFAREQAARRRAWVDAYISTIVQRDVQDLAHIEGLTSLPRLLGLLAARSSGLTNYAELSRTMGLPQTTLKRYLALLEATFLSHPVPSWSANLSRRLVKAPKLFLNDAGLAAALLGVDAGRLGAEGALAGPLLETFVMTELAKQSSWSRTRPRLYHFRTQAGAEVDFVLEDARGRCVGIEVKAGGVGSGDFKGLKALAELLGERFVRGVVLSSSPGVTPFGRNLHALSVDALWRLRSKPI